MNQQWLTILLSKGIEIEQQVRKNLASVKQNIKDELEQRGIRLTPEDLMAVVEEFSPKASHAAISYAMDIMRPFVAGMGLRVSRLSDAQIEVVLPSRARNKNDEGVIHEGALVAATVESAKILWLRHAPVGDLKIIVDKIEIQVFRQCDGDVRIRMELAETLKENVLALLRNDRAAIAEVCLNIFDDNEQAIAEVIIDLKFEYTPSLNHSKK